MALNNILLTAKKYIKDLECSIGKKLIHDTLMMECHVDIINGDTIIHGKNSVVDQGLIGILNYLSCFSYSSGAAASNGFTGVSNSYMVIGSDTISGTTHSTTALVAPIGGGTRPNSQSGATSSPAAGQWQVQWIATWNAATVSGTLGEVGLYLNLTSGLVAFGGNPGGGTTLLCSRMAVADGKFSSFSINTAVPLSIAWTFKLTYAT
jgi:hypothetical protein